MLDVSREGNISLHLEVDRFFDHRVNSRPDGKAIKRHPCVDMVAGLILGGVIIKKLKEKILIS